MSEPFKAPLVVSLVREINAVRTKTSAISGALGQKLADAHDKQGVHVKATKDAARLARMTEQGRDEYLEQFGLYVQACREAGLYGPTHVGDLERLARKAPPDKLGAKKRGRPSKKGPTLVGGSDFEGFK